MISEHQRALDELLEDEFAGNIVDGAFNADGLSDELGLRGAIAPDAAPATARKLVDDLCSSDTDFADLFHNGYTGGDRSAIDRTLILKLVAFTREIADRRTRVDLIETACRMSSLFRDKWDKANSGTSHLRYEIARALNATSPGVRSGAAKTTASVSSSEPIDGSALLEDIRETVRRFVVINNHQLVVIALWIVHTFAFRSFAFSPYLAITSPSKACGKSRLLDVLQYLVHEPMLAASISAAALIRTIAATRPTTLLDEMDVLLNGERERAEVIRGILNGGFHESGAHHMCVGTGNKISVAKFETFCPKAVAGIGTLPDTVISRSIEIKMQRRSRGEHVERLRDREFRPEAEGLRARIATFADQVATQAASLHPQLPEELDDRAQDVIEPLIALAECAGGDWPQRARTAFRELMSSRNADDTDLGVRLLRDVRGIFSRDGGDRISSTQLAQRLVNLDDAPWGKDRFGDFTAFQLAERLREFQVRPRNMRIDEHVVKAYRLSELERAFDRYLEPLKPRKGSIAPHRSEPQPTGAAELEINFDDVPSL